MAVDTDCIDKAVLTLLHLGLHSDGRVLERFEKMEADI
jgi:hypothetical protein